MSEHHITIDWARRPHPARAETYCRDHSADYGEGLSVPVSAAVGYLGNPALADPEQLLVNAVASCHMLFFLAIAEAQGYVVDSYRDNATGTVEKTEGGSFWVSRIDLRPAAVFSGAKQPDEAALNRLHHRAHKGCFVANSVRSQVSVTPVI